MAEFPPTLLITSTRDLGLSSAAVTHNKLKALGRSSDLRIWEGMGHCFLNMPLFPEAEEANALIVKFFDQYLAQ